MIERSFGVLDVLLVQELFEVSGHEVTAIVRYDFLWNASSGEHFRRRTDDCGRCDVAHCFGFWPFGVQVKKDGEVSCILRIAVDLTDDVDF